MSTTELQHLLGRAIDGVVLHGESDRLRELVRELEQRAARPQHAPADRAKLREQYGQVLRRWGLLDEVNDPQATEEFAVTDLLAVTEQQPPTTPTCRPGPYDDCPHCHPEQQPTL